MSSAVKKISISLDTEVHSWAMRTARRQKRSLSAVVDSALRIERQNEAALRVVQRIGAGASVEEATALLEAWSRPPKRPTRRR
jgi:hypothetical protein